MRRLGEALDGRLLAGMPAVLLADAFREDVALGRHQIGDAVAEFGPDLIHRHVRVLHGVVQRGRGQQFLVRRHRGHDFHRFHRMDDIGEALAATLGPGVGADRKENRAVQQFRIECFVCHTISGS